MRIDTVYDDAWWPEAQRCHARKAWDEFWAHPPTSLNDPRLADWLDIRSEWEAEDDEDCPDCAADFQRLRELVARLEVIHPGRGQQALW
jgi:hypothetical protein